MSVDLLRKVIRTLCFCALIVMMPVSAQADAFVLVGPMFVGGGRPSLGVGWSYCPSVLGVEVEYLGTFGSTSRDGSEAGGIQASLIVQPRTTSNRQYFVVGGFGIWGETFEQGGTGALSAMNIGGGLKFAIASHVRLRLDYRLFVLGEISDGSRVPTTKYPQRFSLGLQVVF